MGHCGGNCASCSGCARELVLSQPEIEILQSLAQFAFLPVARQLGDGTPVDPEAENREEASLLLQILEKKGLISLDYDKPLPGCDYGSYGVQGSMALTQRGQTVLDLMEYQGIQQEEAYEHH